MAANLNRPADFFREPTQTQALLIPPSAFEKPVSEGQGKNVDHLQQEIKKLQEENEKLRLLQGPVQGQAASFTGTSHGRYADELIKRQAEEVAESRTELMKIKQAYEEDRFEWEKKLRVCEENHDQELNRLLRQSRLTEENLEERVERLSTELQRTLEIAERESIQWREKYETMSSSLNQRLEDVETEKVCWQRSNEEKRMELEADNRNKAQLIDEQTDTILKLKTYIGEKESSQKSLTVWNVEKETLENKLKLSQAENQKWQSQLELLEIRFKSLNEILSVQEGDLNKAKKDGLGKAKQHAMLLNRWREKVFALLVQQKSSDISYKNSLNTARNNILQLEEELSVQHAQEEVLRHSLKDKEAELQMEVYSKRGLQEELDEAKQVAVCLDDQSKENEEALRGMKMFTERMFEEFQSAFKVLEEKSNQLKTFNQRVSFAASRMEMLKSQMIRQAAIMINTSTGNRSNANNDSRKSMSVSRGDEDVSRDSEEHLYQELERVMRERDSLATQVRDDSTKWSKKLTQTQTQYFTEISTLKKTVEDLEYDIQQKTKKCAQLTDELETLRETEREKDDTIAQLQAELARHARGTESHQRLKDDALYSEKTAELERQLNDSKREHAKTVVNLRQLERNHTREMERSKELLLTTEQHLNSQIIQLRNQLMSLEKERNTLVATLRQEGLLTKLKSDRPEPIHLTLDVNSGDQRKNVDDELFPSDKTKQAAEPKSDGAISIKIGSKDEEPRKFKSDNQGPEIMSARGVPEPVESVIQDLKTLTAVIFDDESDEDTEEYDGKSDSFH